MIKGLPPASFEVIPFFQRNIAATSSSAERRGASGFRGGAAVRMGFPMRAGGRIELPQRHLTSTRLSSFKKNYSVFKSVNVMFGVLEKLGIILWEIHNFFQ